jgi:hypothetical protein
MPPANNLVCGWLERTWKPRKTLSPDLICPKQELENSCFDSHPWGTF